jgi:capsular polysaccharide biosynthesis protein
MPLTTIWLVLRRRAWIVILFAAIALLASEVVQLTSKPIYTATATVIAKNPEGATDRPLSFVEVVSSNKVAQQAIQSAHVNESVDALKASLSVVSGKSDIYEITVRDTDPSRAADLANAVATAATSFYQDLAGGDTVAIQATIDKYRNDANTRYHDASQALLAFDQAHPQVAGAGNRAEPSLGAQRLQLQLDQQAASDAVLNFEAGITQSRLAQISTIRSFESHVLDHAVPIAKGRGGVTTIAFFGGLGLILGIVLVFILEYFTRSIDKPEDAEAYLGAPVVGMIPRTNARSLRRLRTAK